MTVKAVKNPCIEGGGFSFCCICDKTLILLRFYGPWLDENGNMTGTCDSKCEKIKSEQRKKEIKSPPEESKLKIIK